MSIQIMALSLAGLVAWALVRRPTSTIFNCSAEPSVPTWARGIDNHSDNGRVDLARLECIPYEQMKRAFASDSTADLFQGRVVMNANSATHLYFHQEYLRSEWGSMVLMFYGTCFLGWRGERYILALYRRDDRWLLGPRRLDSDNLAGTHLVVGHPIP